MTLRTARITLSLIALAAPAIAKEKPAPNPSLCSIKTVFVEGNNRSADIIRKNIEKKTWLKLTSNSGDADAIMAVRQVGSLSSAREYADVSTLLTNREGELVWSESFSPDAWSPLMSIFSKLNKAASCK